MAFREECETLVNRIILHLFHGSLVLHSCLFIEPRCVWTHFFLSWEKTQLLLLLKEKDTQPGPHRIMKAIFRIPSRFCLTLIGFLRDETYYGILGDYCNYKSNTIQTFNTQHCIHVVTASFCSTKK